MAMSSADSATPLASSEPVSGKGLGVVPDLFQAPTRAFRRLASDPQWLGTAALVLVLFAVAAWIRLPVEIAYSREVAEASFDRFDVPEENREEALARMPDPDNLTMGQSVQPVATGLGVMVVVVILGVLVLWLIGRLAGASNASFRTSSAVLWTASVASGVGAIALGLLARASNTIEVSLAPGALFPYNSLPGIFLDVFDVFSLVVLFLLAIGVREVFRTKPGTSWAIAGTYWILASMTAVAGRLFGAWISGAL
jgi:hypothetical protein